MDRGTSGIFPVSDVETEKKEKKPEDLPWTLLIFFAPFSLLYVCVCLTAARREDLAGGHCFVIHNVFFYVY